MAAGLPLPVLSRGHFASSVPSDRLDATPLDCLECEIVAYTDEALFQATGVRIAFTERSGGCSVGPFASLDLMDKPGDDSWRPAVNRAVVASAFGAEAMPLIVPNQVHGTAIVAVEEDAPDAVCSAQASAQDGCDAVLVGCGGVAALLRFADCLPLILVADSGAFAVVHCGWRSTVGHLASLSLKALCDAVQCAPGNVNAYIGAYIHTSCFGVGDDTFSAFAAELPAGVVDARHIDLGAAVRADLVQVGADEKRIADMGICTACNTDRFFSYRAEGGVTGRHGAFACRFPR